MSSEFGQGLTYNLGLFLCHSERSYGIPQKELMKFEKAQDKRMRAEDNPEYSFSTEMWFNGASDHLYELEIPATFPKRLQTRLKKLQRKSIYWGHGFQQDVKEEDKKWAIQEAKDLLRSIDKLIPGVESKKGQWE